MEKQEIKQELNRITEQISNLLLQELGEADKPLSDGLDKIREAKFILKCIK